MNNKQYINALKKGLEGMDAEARDEILMEIRSHIEEMDDDEQSLMESFGAPDELARQYMDGVIVRLPLVRKVSRWSKDIFRALGIATIFFVVAAGVLIWIFSGDEFDYANEKSSQLNLDSTAWTSIKWDQPLILSVHQAQTVIYWHEKNEVSWNCMGDNIPEPKSEGILSVRHGRCFIYLPRRPADIRVTQAQMVMVRPQADVTLKVEQGSLRIAENESKYRYAIRKVRSHIDPFQSYDDSQILIDIDANEATIESYQYE